MKNLNHVPTDLLYREACRVNIKVTRKALITIIEKGGQNIPALEKIFIDSITPLIKHSTLSATARDLYHICDKRLSIANIQELLKKYDISQTNGFYVNYLGQYKKSLHYKITNL